MELERLAEKDRKREEYKDRKYRRDVRKLVRAKEKKRIDKGVELYPDIADTKAAIRGVQREEEYFALSKDRKKLDEETNKLKTEIDDKFGNLLAEKRPDITALAENKFSKTKVSTDLPEHIVATMTTQETQDLRLVFDMFDVKGKGYGIIGFHYICIWVKKRCF